MTCIFVGDLTAPGAMALVLTPLGPSSSAMFIENPITAAFVARETAKLAPGEIPNADVGFKKEAPDLR
jgi:hypothetical protein